MPLNKKTDNKMDKKQQSQEMRQLLLSGKKLIQKQSISYDYLLGIKAFNQWARFEYKVITFELKSELHFSFNFSLEYKVISVVIERLRCVLRPKMLKRVNKENMALGNEPCR